MCAGTRASVTPPKQRDEKGYGRNEVTTARHRFVAFLGCFLFGTAAADGAPIGDDVNDLPIFDAHMHYHEPAWASVSPEQVIDKMDRNKISRSLLSSGPDSGTVRLFNYAPNRFVPEASPYHDDINKNNWTTADGVFDYLKGRLDQHPHEGMGELVVHSLDPNNTDLMKPLALLAQARNLSMHLHADYKVIETMFQTAPNLTIVWAHAGMVDPPEIVMRTLDKYPSLYADLSYREHQILNTNGSLDAAWRTVLLAHADRFMIGSDTWSNSQWARYDTLIETNRRWLSQMPRKAAEAIAYQNAARVFKRGMSSSLIETR